MVIIDYREKVKMPVKGFWKLNIVFWVKLQGMGIGWMLNLQNKWAEKEYIRWNIYKLLIWITS